MIVLLEIQPQFFFFFVCFTEIHLATSSMRIQLRKGRSFTRDGHRTTNAMLQEKRKVKRLVDYKDAI